MMSRLSLLQTLPRLASAMPFLCWMFAQWECPAMGESSYEPRVAASLGRLLFFQSVQFPPDLGAAGVVLRTGFGRVPALRLLPGGLRLGRAAQPGIDVAQVVPDDRV